MTEKTTLGQTDATQIGIVINVRAKGQGANAFSKEVNPTEEAVA